MMEERIQLITSSESDVIKTMRALDVNKALDHDNISVRMIKLCTNSVAHPLTCSPNFKTLWLLVHLLPNRKEKILLQFTRRIINK